MRIDILTAVPELLEGFFDKSILGRAQKKGLAEIYVHNLRDYTTDKHGRLDDYPFGGFPGMVMQCQPIDDCISKLKSERDYDEIIFVTPDGEQFDQPMANELSLKGEHTPLWRTRLGAPLPSRPRHFHRPHIPHGSSLPPLPAPRVCAHTLIRSSALPYGHYTVPEMPRLGYSILA